MKLPVSMLLLIGICLAAACTSGDPVPGAERTGEYLPLLKDKKIALVANHTSLVKKTHLVDTLISSGISKSKIRVIFCPEHGFRGDHAAGEVVDDKRDPLTGIPVISLYGKNKKPLPEQMKGIDVVLFTCRMWGFVSTPISPRCTMFWKHVPRPVFPWWSLTVPTLTSAMWMAPFWKRITALSWECILFRWSMGLAWENLRE